jgi:hypothetical protein
MTEDGKARCFGDSQSMGSTRVFLNLCGFGHVAVKMREHQRLWHDLLG